MATAIAMILIAEKISRKKNIRVFTLHTYGSEFKIYKGDEKN